MVKIETMTLEHIDQIMEIENQCFKVPWTYNDFKDTLEYDNIDFFVAIDKDKIAGYCGIYMSLDQADIANIAVSSLYRRKGIGNQLLTYALLVAKTKNIKDIFLEVRQSNKSAINLYKKQGFKQVGIRKAYYSNPTEDALLMAKTI